MVSMHALSLQTLTIRLPAAIIGVGNLTAGVMVGWRPKWHNSTSLARFGELVAGHWSIIGVALIGAGGLIMITRTRVAGYGITSFVYLLAAFWLLYVSTTARASNGLAVVGLFMLGLILLCGAVTALHEQGRRRDVS